MFLCIQVFGESFCTARVNLNITHTVNKLNNKGRGYFCQDR